MTTDTFSDTQIKYSA